MKLTWVKCCSLKTKNYYPKASLLQYCSRHSCGFALKHRNIWHVRLPKAYKCCNKWNTSMLTLLNSLSWVPLGIMNMPYCSTVVETSNWIRVKQSSPSCDDILLLIPFHTECQLDQTHTATWNRSDCVHTPSMMSLLISPNPSITPPLFCNTRWMQALWGEPERASRTLAVIVA